MLRFQLVGHDHRGLGGEPEPREVLSIQMQTHGLSEALHQLVESVALGDHGDFEAFGDVAGVLSTPYDRFDGVLKTQEGPSCDQFAMGRQWCPSAACVGAERRPREAARCDHSVIKPVTAPVQFASSPWIAFATGRSPVRVR